MIWIKGLSPCKIFRSGLLKCILLACILGFFNIQCQKEPDELIRKKLEVILQSDLEAITSDIAKEGLLEKPFFKITLYKDYKESFYSKRAEVDFYFLKKIHYKIIRKYRYHRQRQMWERYFNEYKLVPDTSEKTP